MINLSLQKNQNHPSLIQEQLNSSNLAKNKEFPKLGQKYEILVTLRKIWKYPRSNKSSIFQKLKITIINCLQLKKMANQKNWLLGKSTIAKESFSVGWILKLNYVVNQFKIRLFCIYSWSAADLNKVDFDAGALRRNSIWKTLEI